MVEKGENTDYYFHNVAEFILLRLDITTLYIIRQNKFETDNFKEIKICFTQFLGKSCPSYESFTA